MLDRKKPVITFVFCCMILIKGLAAPNASQGNIVLSVKGSNIKNVGVFKDSESPVAEYTVVNSGNTDLRIKEILKTCGCNYAKVDKKDLAPGEEAKVSVGIEPHTLDGPFSKLVYVVTEPKSKKMVSLTVTGECVPLFNIRPAIQINAGKLKNGVSWKGSFDISTKSPVTFGETAITSNCPASAELKQAGALAWELPVSLTTPTNSKFKCKITLPVIKPENRPPLTFQISGRSGTELIAIPRTLIIKKNGPYTKNVTLKIIGKRGRKLNPEELTVTPKIKGLSCKSEPERNGGLRLELIISKELSERLSQEDTMQLNMSVPDAAPAILNIKHSRP